MPDAFCDMPEYPFWRIELIQIFPTTQSAALGKNELQLRGASINIFALLIYDIYHFNASMLFEVEHICKVELKA
jgi:hypothetical protein